MDVREFEKMLERLLNEDLSKGTDAFRDALLARCLDVLGSDDHTQSIDGDGGIRPIDESDLEFLAAAGDIDALLPHPPEA